MIDSDNITTLPSVSRRLLLAGIAAAVPLAVVPVNVIAPECTPLTVLFEEYAVANAIYDRLWRFADDVDSRREHLRVAWYYAKKKLEKLETDHVLFPPPTQASQSAAIETFINSDNPSFYERFAGAVGRLEYVPNANAPELLDARRTVERTRAELDAFDNTIQFAAEDAAVEEAERRRNEIAGRIEATRPTNLMEYLQKLEFLADKYDGCQVAVVDIFDLALADLAPLGRIDYRTTARTDELDRMINWGPSVEDVA